MSITGNQEPRNGQGQRKLAFVFSNIFSSCESHPPSHNQNIVQLKDSASVALSFIHFRNFQSLEFWAWLTIHAISSSSLDFNFSLVKRKFQDREI